MNVNVNFSYQLNNTQQTDTKIFSVNENQSDIKKTFEIQIQKQLHLLYKNKVKNVKINSIENIINNESDIKIQNIVCR